MIKFRIYLLAIVMFFLMVGVSFATVSSSTNIKRVNGDGSTVAFTFPFKVLENDDLNVYWVDDTTSVATIKTEGTHYTVAFNADHNGGTVTFDASYVPASTVDVLLVNEPTLTQSTDFPSEGQLNEAALEAALDRSILVDTSQAEILNRSLKFKQSDPYNTTNYNGLYFELDTLANRSGKVLQWTSDGTEIEAGADASDLADLAEDADAAAASAAAAASSASSSASSATAAAASAVTAADAANGFKATSTTAVAVGTGSKTFTTQSGKLFAVGDQVIAASAADGTKYIHGNVTSYSGTTLIVNSIDAGAAGTPSDWNISISGTQGPVGATGPTGATGASGAGTGDMLAAQNLADLANASTARTNLGVAIGTDVQAYDATLLSISTLGTAADKMLYTTGVDTWAEQAITSAGRALLDDAAASNQRTTLGLGTAAVLDVGTTASKVVQLDGSAKLPAVDGSALTNLPTGGDYVLLSTCTASVSATCDFTSLITSTYSTYIFEIDDLRPATDNVNLILYSSTNNGSSWDSHNFTNIDLPIGTSTPTYTNNGLNDGTTAKRVGNAAGEGISGTVTLRSPLGTAREKMFTWVTTYHDPAGLNHYSQGLSDSGLTSDIDAVRFLFDSGNITSGKIRMYGLSAT